MKRAGYITVALAIFMFAAPGFASASTISVKTAQVIPAGGSACAPLAVQSVTPYIVNNELNSFDVTIADTQYVSILATAGNTAMPFNFMSRWKTSDGMVRIHVDMDPTPIYGSLPVTLTLLSAQTGQPVCLSIVSFSVLGNAVPVYHPTPSKGGTHPSTTPTSTVATSTATSTTVVGSVTRVSLGERLQRTCAGKGSLELWFVLITLFLIGTAVVALAQPPLTERHEVLPSALISVPFVLLAAFWFFAPMCRGAGWVPFVLLAIAVAGVVLAYRDRSPITAMIQLPPPAQKPVATTPSKQAVPVTKS